VTQKRNRRSGVEDRWFKTVRGEDNSKATVPSGRHGVGMRWRARYVDDQGQEHNKMFRTKAEANSWLNEQTSAIQAGTHVAPRDARLTVAEWCDTWIEGYKVNRESTVRQARTHIKHIKAGMGDTPLVAVRPSAVKSWVAGLKAAGFEDSYVYALHNRLTQILGDAVLDGVLGRNPCSKRTSPPAGKQKPYCATTEQVWALHDAVPDHLRVAILLGAFVGLRVAEVSGLRVEDVDFIRGVILPVQQWGGKPLKTEGSSAPIPIPADLSLLLSASVQKYPSTMMVTNGPGTDRCGPWIIERAIREAKAKIDGLPEEFSFHDLRHYLASLLISKGEDVKTVQARLRHATASTTLDTYGHLWPDADESTRSVIAEVISERADSTAVPLRSRGPKRSR
jgi:integrase